MQKRQLKETKQQQIEKCLNILKQCMADHLEIEPPVWASAFWSILAEGYINSGFSYSEFEKEWDGVKNHYKNWFK